MSDINIELLADVPEQINILAEWTYSEWGHFDPSNSLEKTKNRLLQRVNRISPPICFVAFRNSKPVGCASVKLDDMPERYPNAHFWVGSMYVLPQERVQGVGSALMRLIKDSRSELGIEDLFLWTATAERFYSRHGFEPIERFHHLDQDVVVMKLEKSVYTAHDLNFRL